MNHLRHTLVRAMKTVLLAAAHCRAVKNLHYFYWLSGPKKGQWVEINIKGAYSSAPDSFIKINVLVHYIYLIKYNSSFKMKE